MYKLYILYDLIFIKSTKSSGISVRIYQEDIISNDIATTNLFPGG